MLKNKENNKKKFGVAIIIPAYNEGLVINRVVTDIKQALNYESLNYKVIVVNDASSDDTYQQAEKAGAYVINHIYNTGSGGATATGLRYAKDKHYDLAATIDGDGQHYPEDLVNGLRIIMNSDADLLIGSRLIDSTGMPRLKVAGNKILSLITFYLFGVKVTDSQSGLRIFSTKALRTLNWKTYGYSFCSEMIWRAKQKRLIINEYPIKALYTEYSVKKGQNNWGAVTIIKALVKCRLMELFSE